MRLQRRKNSRFCGQSLEKKSRFSFLLTKFSAVSSNLSAASHLVLLWSRGLERLKNGQFTPWTTDLIEMYLQHVLKHFKQEALPSHFSWKPAVFMKNIFFFVRKLWAVIGCMSRILICEWQPRMMEIQGTWKAASVVFKCTTNLLPNLKSSQYRTEPFKRKVGPAIDLLDLDLVLVFTKNREGHPTTVFCKTSVQRNKYCLEFYITWGRLKISRWPFHSLPIFPSLSYKFPTIFWSLIFTFYFLS